MLTYVAVGQSDLPLGRRLGDKKSKNPLVTTSAYAKKHAFVKKDLAKARIYMEDKAILFLGFDFSSQDTTTCKT